MYWGKGGCPLGDDVRFWLQVDIGAPNYCWMWKGGLTRGGYGTFFNGAAAQRQGRQRLIRAHRFAWEQINGEIPSGMFVCHTCDEPACVNPRHLYLGTPAENSADMKRKGRTSQGPHRELVPEVRRLASEGVPQVAICDRLGLPRWTVSRIVNRDTYEACP